MTKIKIVLKVLCWIIVIWCSLNLSAFFIDIEWQEKFVSYPFALKVLSGVSFIINIGFIIIGYEATKFTETSRKCILALATIDLIHSIIGSLIYSTMYVGTSLEALSLACNIGFDIVILIVFSRKAVSVLFNPTNK